MQFSRSKPAAEVEFPTPAILVAAAVASVKPASLSRKEVAVSELRDRRSQLSAEFSKHLDALRTRGGGSASKPTAAMVDLQKRLDALDADIRTARADMIQARQDFKPEFNRVTNEFRDKAADKLAQATALIADAHGSIAAIEHCAQCSGIEVGFCSHLLRDAAVIIAAVSRKG